MNKNLLIVFVKNSQLGKVKTRLAKSIGNKKAFLIYNELVAITEKETKHINVDRHIYFSKKITPSKWERDKKYIQEGENLGEKMQQAFQRGFNQGYKNIILIGSDLPDISKKIINLGFEKLKNNNVVFGPAHDGGYYLIGMNKMIPYIFKNKPWSQSILLEVTLQELKNQTVGLLEPLNDIDTFEDLMHSDFYKQNPHIQKIINEVANP